MSRQVRIRIFEGATTVWVAVAVALYAGCSGEAAPAQADAADATATAKLTPQLGGPPTQAGKSGPIAVVVRNSAGKVVPGAITEFTAELGGGSLEAAVVTADSDGLAKTTWKLGPAPIRQSVRASALGSSVVVEVVAQLPTPWTPEAFFNAQPYLQATNNDASTEDLVFGADGKLHLVAGSAIFTLDSTAKPVARHLTGDTIVAGLGLAADSAGNLWVADNKGHALRKVTPQGVVSTALKDDGANPLLMPNDVAVDAQGRVWLTDTCLGKLLRFDPATSKVDRSITFDPLKDGGPNGLAIAADGAVWMTTENVGLFCGKPVEITADVAGLYRIDPADPAPKATIVAAKMGIFGDGLTFDVHGNLYAIFDRQANFALTESTVWVFNTEAQQGKTQPVRFLSASDRVYANIVFGKGEFGKTTAYLALLAVPPFTTAIGVERFVVGVEGF